MKTYYIYYKILTCSAGPPADILVTTAYVIPLTSDSDIINPRPNSSSYKEQCHIIFRNNMKNNAPYSF